MQSKDINDTLLNLAGEYAATLERVAGESLVAIVLFGSVARREATPYSDIDLLIVAEKLPQGRFARQEWLQAAENLLEPKRRSLYKEGMLTDFCPIIKTPEEARQITPFYLDFVEDAVILYERDGFFSAVLEKLRQSLSRLGARRMRLGKIRYWELKPDYVPGEIFEL